MDRGDLGEYRSRAHALMLLGEHEAGIETLRAALVQFADVDDPEVRDGLVHAKAALARHLVEAGHYDQALIALDAYLAEEPEDVHEVSWALVQQGMLLLQAERFDEGLEVYARLLERLDGATELALRVRRTIALWNSTEALGRSGRLDEAMAANERLVEEVGDDAAEIFAVMAAELDGRDDPQARVQRVGILLKEAQVHFTAGRVGEGMALVRELVACHAGDDLPDVRRMVAMAREQLDEDDLL